MKNCVDVTDIVMMSKIPTKNVTESVVMSFVIH